MAQCHEKERELTARRVADRRVRAPRTSRCSLSSSPARSGSRSTSTTRRASTTRSASASPSLLREYLAHFSVDVSSPGTRAAAAHAGALPERSRPAGSRFAPKSGERLRGEVGRGRRRGAVTVQTASETSRSRTTRSCGGISSTRGRNEPGNHRGGSARSSARRASRAARWSMRSKTPCSPRTRRRPAPRAMRRSSSTTAAISACTRSSCPRTSRSG